MRMTITVIGTLRGPRYNVDVEGGRIHILNAKSLRWNLKHIFKMDKTEVGSIMLALDLQPQITIELQQVGAA